MYVSMAMRDAARLAAGPFSLPRPPPTPATVHYAAVSSRFASGWWKRYRG